MARLFRQAMSAATPLNAKGIALAFGATVAHADLRRGGLADVTTSEARRGLQRKLKDVFSSGWSTSRASQASRDAVVWFSVNRESECHGIDTPSGRICVLCTAMRPSGTHNSRRLRSAPAGASRHWHAIGTASGRLRRRLVGVYLGLPATAAVADMPVGAPPPFASALEPSSGRTRTSEARPGSP